ncbi:MAG: DoxX family protein [Gammaproteobacteria bacterium]|nr:MAG: DoxX family protein [Gammaproteobacteria bacterium]
MTDLRLAPYAAATLRLALGVMFLAHSVGLKLLTFGLPGTAHFFVSVGLPAWLGYLTFAAEAAGGVLLVLGVQSRWVALSLVLPLVGAIVWVHAGNGWVFTAPNGGWEYPAYLVILCVVQAMLGDGVFALGATRSHDRLDSVAARSTLRR